jgi:integrase/recombinase XerD
MSIKKLINGKQIETYDLEVEEALFPSPRLGIDISRYQITEDSIPLYEVNRYLDEVSLNSPLTGKDYAYKLMNYLRFLKAKYQKHYKDIQKKEIIISYVKYLVHGDNELRDIQGKKSRNAIKQELSVIKGFYEWLEDRNEIKNNPVIYGSKKSERTNKKHLKSKFLYGQIFDFDIEKDNITKKLRYTEQRDYVKWYEDDEINNIQSKLRSMRDKIVFKALIETGARIGEMLGVRLEDFNMDEGIIRIVKRQSNENNSRVKTMERDLYISEQLTSEIADYMRGERIDADVNYSEYLFLNHKGKNKGKPLEQRNYLQILKGASKKAGFDAKKIRTHSGRSTHAQILLEELYNGTVSEGYILQQMGWNDISTLKKYTRAYNEKNRVKISRMILEKRIRLAPIAKEDEDK